MMRFTGCLTLVLACAMTGSATAAPLKALIVDGQNNHNWAACTPPMKKILEDTGLFTVDVATSPAKGEDMSGFKPDFAAYDVIIGNYTGDEWPEATKKAFVEYMAGGGGFVVVHAADNAFPNWKEYNEMIALGGWGGRNEKNGPYVYFKEGKIVRDDSPGRGGSHGPQHPYAIVVRDSDHPITKGLPERFMHSKDELYDSLRGPAKNLTVLATAFSEKTQRDEPALMTIAFGEGRVFHTILGHSPEQMRSVAFIVTLQRGAEWAATGKVTQAVPDDMPSADEPSMRASE